MILRSVSWCTREEQKGQHRAPVAVGEGREESQGASAFGEGKRADEEVHILCREKSM